MVEAVRRKVETTLEAQAWRVEFSEDPNALPDGVETIEIAEPRNVIAALSPLAPSYALAQTGPDQTAGALTVVWLPPGVNAPSTIERDADEWMRDAWAQRKEAIVRADVRTVRVVWDETRAVMYAGQSDIHYALDAIVRFSVVQKEALALEAAVRSAWTSIAADADLTHAVRRRDQRRQRHVNQMTVIAAQRKIAWLRVSRSIEQLDPAPPDPSKRLFAELVSAAALYDRMEMLEDPIQFAMDQYELANTRLTEANQAHKELVHSIVGYIVIIVLLVLQILLMMGLDGVHPVAPWV